MNVKNALTRKLGPLPAWAWFLAFAGGVWYYRKRTGGGSVSGTGTGSVGPAPTTPQPGQVLQPGESYYDPNSGALTTAPGSGMMNYGPGGVDPNQTINDLATAIEQAIAASTPGTVSPNPSGAPSTGGPPPPGKTRVRVPPGFRFGGKNPGKGWVGIGGGWWRKRNVKSKTGHTKPPDKHGNPKRSRPNAAIRHPRPSKPKKVASKRVSIGRNPSAQSNSRLRQKKLTPAVKPVIRQRPVASIRPSHRQAAAPNHRPSAPPPRKHRVQRHK